MKKSKNKRNKRNKRNKNKNGTKKITENKDRNLTILKAFKNEINLSTKVQKDKTKYNKSDRADNKKIKEEE